MKMDSINLNNNLMKKKKFGFYQIQEFYSAFVILIIYRMLYYKINQKKNYKNYNKKFKEIIINNNKPRK